MGIVQYNARDTKDLLPELTRTKEEGIFERSRSTIISSSFTQMNMIGEYLVDQRFSAHFKNLKQVFMYITDRCNISCKQCIYKPSTNHYINEEIPLTDALSLLTTFRELGASKVTFLGGEPTLYGCNGNQFQLLNLINKTKEIGFEYIRLDTNGQNISHFLPETNFKLLNEIAFSLDGFSKGTNDILRGDGTFENVVRNIRKSISLGYKVTITCCVHRQLLTKDNSDTYLIEKMIDFAQELGVYQINFHDLFKAGVPMDTWTGDFAPTPKEWVDMYNVISQKIIENKFEIKIRLPQCFIEMKEFNRNPKYFGYCPVKLGERVMVHPNGTIRICSNLICTGFGTARYEKNKILWDNTHNNEMAGHELNKNTPCTNRSRHRKYGKFVPLCFSFKPNQNEHVWKTKLDWDANKNKIDGV